MSLPHGIAPDDVRAWADEHFPHRLRWRGAQGTGRAPYREDKNPSFSFSAEKGTWHDFASNESGGLLDLAGRLGVDPPWAMDEGGNPPSQAGTGFLTLWDAAKAADGGHPYLQRKCISCTEGLRQSGEVLLVPCYNEPGEIVGVERVWPDGRKMHLGSKSGVFPSGKLEPGSPVVLAEGFATGASIHEATGLPVLCTFGGSGIKRTAEALRRRHPGLEIIAATDADEAGRRAARESGGLAVIPDGPEHFDWNDFFLRHGAGATREAFMRGLEEARRAAGDDGTISAAELLRKVFPPPRWAIPGLLPEGLTLLIAPPKAGKSTLALHLAIAVSCGGVALGKYDCQGGDVLYLALEDSEVKMQQKLVLAGRDADSPRLDLRFTAPRIGEGLEGFLEGWLAKHQGARAVIIDVLQRVRPPKWAGVDSYEADYRTLTALKAIADKYNIAMLILHHTRKLPRDGQMGDFLEESLGSQALTGAVDNIVLLRRKRRETAFTLHTAGRDIEEQEIAGDYDRESGTYSIQGEAAEVRMTDTRRRVFEALRSEGGEAHYKTVAMHLDTRPESCKMLLWRMWKNGELLKGEREGVYSLPSLREEKGKEKGVTVLPMLPCYERYDVTDVTNVTNVTALPESDVVTAVTAAQGDVTKDVTGENPVFARVEGGLVTPVTPVTPTCKLYRQIKDGSGKEQDCPAAEALSSILSTVSTGESGEAAGDSFLSAEDLPPPAQERYRDAYERMRRANISHEIAHQRALDRAREVARRLQAEQDDPGKVA